MMNSVVKKIGEGALITLGSLAVKGLTDVGCCLIKKAVNKNGEVKEKSKFKMYDLKAEG